MWPFLKLVMVAVLVLFFMLDAAASLNPNPKFEMSCFSGVGATCTMQLRFVGTIEPGDAAIIETQILQTPGIVSSALFNSPGGDAFEAIKIGDVLNKYFVEMWTPNCRMEQGKQSCMLGLSPKEGGPLTMCASACAFIYLISNNRFGEQALIHRPTFPRTMFAGLSANEARLKYEEASNKLIKQLQKRGVDSKVLELMASTPSDHLLDLPRNIPARSPWLDEWLTAKCPDRLSATQEKRRNDLDGRLFVYWQLLTGKVNDPYFNLTEEEKSELRHLEAIKSQHGECEYSALMTERKRAQKK